MGNGVIEKINTTLESAEELKSAGYHEITLDLNSYITILKRLAEYENMEPVAWVCGDEEIDDFNRGYEVMVMRDCDDPTFDYIPLYRHPSK